IQAKEILRLKAILNDILAKNTKQKVAKIVKDTERDFFMSAQEAKEYGLIDKVLEKSFK
ncbi:ATP-dependent Clp protease proteolytic subunit, partial [Campylobacter coli]